MKGVLVKDLYIARSNILVTIVSLVVLGFGLSFLLETSALLVLAPVAATTAAFISITSDAASKWNKNVITMPVSRNQIIGEKFLFYILLAVLGMLVAVIPCVSFHSVAPPVTPSSGLLFISSFSTSRPSFFNKAPFCTRFFSSLSKSTSISDAP